MVRLPHHVLQHVHAFLLELHACSELEALRRVIPEGLRRLIPCDRASLNELNSDPETRTVLPAPIPPWWSRYGDVYERHMLDHPLWQRRSRHVVQLSDDPGWSRSALRHEYFEPLGIRHQLSAFVFARGPSLFGVACNRQRHDFGPTELQTLALVAPHLRLALENARLFSSFRSGERSSAASPPAVALTAREAEVLHWIREGKRNAEIATILGISPRTIGKHVEHLLEKLGVETRTAAACLALDYLPTRRIEAPTPSSIVG